MASFTISLPDAGAAFCSAIAARDSAAAARWSAASVLPDCDAARASSAS